MNDCDLVCFDLDGTLVDLQFKCENMENVREDLQELFLEYYVNLDFYPLLPSIEEAIEKVQVLYGDATSRELGDRAYDRVERADLYAAERAAIRWRAKPLLERLEAADIPWVIVTNNSGAGATKAMRLSGLPMPRTIYGRDDVSLPKPEPEMISMALSDHERVSKFVMIGDKITDAKAAKASVRDKDISATTVLVNSDEELPPKDSQYVDVVVDYLPHWDHLEEV